MQGISAMLSRRVWLVLVVAVFGVLASAGTASAANSYTVNDTNDAPLASGQTTSCVSTRGDCTLRAAVQAADNAGGGSTITLPAGTYKLSIFPACQAYQCDTNDPSQGDLDVNNLDNGAAITINGAGSGTTTINAQQVDRAFAVQSDTNGNSTTGALTLSGLTIENGYQNCASTACDEGGAIYSDGALTTSSDVVFSNNISDEDGGAIYADSGSGSSLSITGTTFNANSAYNDAGGAIYDGSPNADTISSSSLTNNSSEYYGGAIYDDNSSTDGLSIDKSTLSNNVTYYSDDEGGGALFVDNSAPVSITNSTLSGNVAENSGYGGAINDESSTTLTLSNDWLNGNSSDEQGGAIYADASNTTLTKLVKDEFDNNFSYDGGAVTWEVGDLESTGSTFIGNDAYDAGGALFAENYDNNSLTLVNDTMSKNTARSIGGGMYFDNYTPAAVNNDTIAFNTPDGVAFPDALDASTYTPPSGAAASVTAGVQNTIVAENTYGDCITSSFSSSGDPNGYNMDKDGSCFGGPLNANDKPNTNPNLGQPADNGGVLAGDPNTGQTTILTDSDAGGPAVDAGTNVGCPGTDARDVIRPATASDPCDIGAFESVGATLGVNNSAPSSATTNLPFTYTISVSNGGPGPSTGTTVVDQLPAGETLWGATPSQGSCSSAGSPAKVSCALGVIANGASATVILTVSEANAGSVSDTANATNDQGSSASGTATTQVAKASLPTGSKPAAKTGGHSHVTKHSARLLGKVSTGGQPTWYFFQYGRSKKLGLASKLVKITSSKNVAARISHLLAGKGYFYRLVAINDSGVSYGAKHHFKTKKAKHHKK